MFIHNDLVDDDDGVVPVAFKGLVTKFPRNHHIKILQFAFLFPFSLKLEGGVNVV